MASQRSRIARWAVLGVAVSVTTGCGKSDPERVEVAGVVTYQGKPLTIGEVSLHPIAGEVSRAIIGRDGHYRFMEARPGEYTVTVLTPPVPKAGVKPARTMPNRPVPVYTPEKFARKESSGLRLTVPAPDQKYDIPLAD